MANVRLTGEYRPTKKAASKGGDWDSLTVRRAANGFSIQKCFDYQPGQKEKAAPPPYLATEPGQALDYLEECLGPGEHNAHEAKEEASEKE